MDNRIQVPLIADDPHSAHLVQAERCRSLMANIPDVVWTTDSEGNTIFISPNVERVYGYTPQEIYRAGDELWLERIHPDDVVEAAETLIR